MAELNNRRSSDSNFNDPFKAKHVRRNGVSSNSLYTKEEKAEHERIAKQVIASWKAVERGEGESLTYEESIKRLRY